MYATRPLYPVVNASWAVHPPSCSHQKLASATLRRLVVRAAAPVYLRVVQCSAACAQPSHHSSLRQTLVNNRMKQRGIASFFGGGKAENGTKGVVTKAGGSAVTNSRDPSDVLKEANSAVKKRPREVIRQVLCNKQFLVSNTHLRILCQESETTAASTAPEAPKTKLKRLRKADSTETPAQVIA